MTRALRRYECPAAGITRHQLESPYWEQVSHGLHAPLGLRLCLSSHADALARMLRPDAAFGHVTGAALRGWPLPWLPDGLPLFASTAGDLHVQRHGVYVRRARQCPATTVSGVTLLAVPDTLAELARDLQLVDLVPVVDAALQAEGLSTADVLGDLLPGTHGLPRLREALTLADPRAESYWESVLRLVHQLGGVTEVKSQVWIGDRLARATCGSSAPAESSSTTAANTGTGNATTVTSAATNRCNASAGSGTHTCRPRSCTPPVAFSGMPRPL